MYPSALNMVSHLRHKPLKAIKQLCFISLSDFERLFLGIEPGFVSVLYVFEDVRS
jgi:hypothetical protein